MTTKKDMAQPNDELFNEDNAVKSNWVKFGKINDFIKGTLIDVREMTSTMPGKEGQKVKVYELLTHAGSFHDMDENKNPVEPAIVINEGEYWNVGGKVGIDTQMRNVKLGTIVGMRFADEKPSKTKGFSATKIIRIYVGGQDPNYMGQTAQDSQ